jgi:hypothetical protein
VNHERLRDLGGGLVPQQLADKSESKLDRRARAARRHDIAIDDHALLQPRAARQEAGARCDAMRRDCAPQTAAPTFSYL